MVFKVPDVSAWVKALVVAACLAMPALALAILITMLAGAGDPTVDLWGCLFVLVIGAPIAWFGFTFLRHCGETIDVDARSISCVRRGGSRLVMNWADIAHVKLGGRMFPLTLREATGGRTMRVWHMLKGWPHLLRVVYERRYLAGGRARPRPDLPVTYTIASRALPMTLLLGALLGFASTLGCALAIPASDPNRESILAAVATLSALALLMGCIVAWVFPWRFTITETGVIQHYLRGRRRITPFAKVTNVLLVEPPFRIAVALRDESKQLPLWGAREGDFAVYHVLQTAWEAWTVKNAKGESAAPGTTEGPALDARPDGV